MPVDLSLCQKSITIPNISIDEVGTVTVCYENTGRCLKTYYDLYMKISTQYCKKITPNKIPTQYCKKLTPNIYCKKITPNISDNCMEIGLVRISAESGGSIGYLTTVTIYGIIKDPITDKVFMTPLVDFDSLNEALNYIDTLEK